MSASPVYVTLLPPSTSFSKVSGKVNVMSSSLLDSDIRSFVNLFFDMKSY
jgi:hypothetical protein